MHINRLELNTNKSELLWCATARRQHQLSRNPFRIGPDTIIPSTAVRDLGIDSDLSMKTHVQRSVAGCFAVRRQLRSIRRVVPSSVYQSLVVALVLSRLDYGNATLAGLPACLLNRLQSVLNAAARSVDRWSSSLGAYYRRSRQFSLASRAPERIKFKLAVIVYQALHGTAPQYMSAQLQYVTDLSVYQSLVACARRLPVFLKSARHDMSLSAIAHLPLPTRDSGTVYLMMSSLPHRSQHFAEN